MGKNVKFDTVMNGGRHCLEIGLFILNFWVVCQYPLQITGVNFELSERAKKIDPEEAAKLIVEQLTGIKFSGENVQQKLF